MSEFRFDLDSPVVKLCVAGTQAEYAGRREEARALYQQAWDERHNDVEACIAAHYVARHQRTPEDTLHWNRVALEHADRASGEELRSFYPSLYLNMARSYEELGSKVEVRRYYELARQSAYLLADTCYVEMVRSSQLTHASNI